MRVQQQVCVLRGTGEGEELQAARQVLKEARNSRAVSVCAFTCQTAAQPLFFNFVL